MKAGLFSIAAALISTATIGKAIEVYIPSAKMSSDNNLELSTKWAKEIFKDRLVFTSGVTFEPDGSGADCFVREGIYQVTESGIKLIHVRSRTDLYERYNIDREHNLANIEFGDEKCRYKITVQREVNTQDGWKKSEFRN